VRIGPFQSWVATLRDAQGKPVTGARISIDGGMLAQRASWVTVGT
jgi:hypothetical protein